MPEQQDILISPERHIVLLGQFGTIHFQIRRLERTLREAGGEQFLPFLDELKVEFEYLKKYYPDRDGNVTSETAMGLNSPLDLGLEPVGLTQTKKRLVNTWRDIRLFVDMAYLNYTLEGHIDCHLKVMLDEALDTQKELLNVDGLDDIPF